MKKAYFFIDDTIWVFRDLTRKKPASLFDNPFMKMLKGAHDKYGMKVQLNVFYRTDTYYGYDQFSLADMTDSYKSEFEASSNWLKMAFHALQEFPDYPHVNATYEDTKWLFENIRKEVTRFAGENSFCYVTDPHWDSMSYDGVRALKDCGVKLLYTTYGVTKEYNGDPNSLPYGHAARLIHNHQPETVTYTRTHSGDDIARSICSYNHVTEEAAQSILRTDKALYDEKTGLYLKPFSEVTLNLVPENEMETAFATQPDWDYFGICLHEQYFYHDYFGYQPEYERKILKMCEIMTNAGYTFINGDEILN